MSFRNVQGYFNMEWSLWIQWGKKKRVKYMETCIIKDLFPKIKAVKLGSRNTILLL